MENTATSPAGEESCADCGTLVTSGLQSRHIQGLCDHCEQARVECYPDLRKASRELYDRLQEYLDVSDEQLIEQGYDGLVRAMDELEAAWRQAQGMAPPRAPFPESPITS